MSYAVTTCVNVHTKFSRQNGSGNETIMITMTMDALIPILMSLSCPCHSTNVIVQNSEVAVAVQCCRMTIARIISRLHAFFFYGGARV